MRIADFSVDRPVTITMLVMIVMVIGTMSFSRLGVDLMPDIDFPMLSIMTRYDGASGQDIERLVTRPLEGAVASVTGVSSIQSVSQEDSSVLMIEFDWGTDLDAAAEDLREALGLIEQFLPEEAGDPMVLKFSLSAFPIVGFGISGFDDDELALGNFLEDDVAPRLERLEGVAQVIMMGKPEQEVQVLVDRAALHATQLSLNQIVQGLFAQNLDLPGGRVIDAGSEYLLRTLGAFDDLDDIAASPIGATRAGQPLRVQDVAEVQLGVKESRNLTRTNGGASVMMMINKQSGANPLQVVTRVKEEVARIEQELGGKVQFALIMDTGEQIEQMANNVISSGVIGALLAVAFMFVFLRSVRPTLIVALAVPLSLLATFIPIFVADQTLNVMTMGGLMLGVGMLVDNAVVVIENVFRHLEEGEHRLDAARNGTNEVATAIIASTLTTMAVFLPLFFGGGIAGQLVFGLAIVVAFSLAASLLVALTMVPMLASVLFTRQSAEAGKDAGWFIPLQNAYVRLLEACLRRRWTTLGTVGGLVLLSLLGVPIVGTTFLPGGDQALIMGLVQFPVGTPIEVTDRATRSIEAVAASIPGVMTVAASVGVNEDDRGAALNEMSPSGVHEAQLFLRLAEDRALSQDEVMARLRAGLPQIEGMTVELMDMGQAAMGGGGNKPVQIDVLGPDLDELRRIGGELVALLSEVPGLVDIDSSLRETKPERHLMIDRERASSYGLSAVEIARTVQAASLGTLAGVYRDGVEEHYIRVRYDARDRDDLGELSQINLSTMTGMVLPVSQVASFEPGEGPVQVRRKDQARRLTVSANLVDRDIGGAIAEIRTRIAPLEATLPSEYQVEIGGTYEQMMEAFGQLLQALLLALLLVYMVMASQFEAFVHPLVIMVCVPLAAVGVVGAQLLAGTPISVVTFVGVIMLAGIVVNNGIVLIDYINQLRAEGMERRPAILIAGRTRLRAILITSGTTITALLPSIFFPGRGSEIVTGISLALAGGLLTSTLLTLLVVPVVYELLDSAGERGSRFLRRLVLGEDDPAPQEPA